MKRIIFFAFALLAIFYQTSNAQNEYLDYRVQDTISDENFTIFNVNDFRDALVQLGINVYKWNLPIPHDKDYKLKFYVQEYEKTKLIKDTVIEEWSTKIWGFDENNRAEYQYLKNLRIITEMPNGEGEKLKIRFSLNSGKYQFGKRIKLRPEIRNYYLRQFDETDFEIDKNIPLLLFTSGWKVNAEGKIVQQYCGPNRPPSDLNDQTFKDSEHYFVIGYRVVDEEFYGKD